MGKVYNWFGREVFDSKVYVKVFTIDQSVPTPSGNSTLVILGEAPNGLKFGQAIQAANSLADNKAMFGDSNPIIQAIAHAQSPSGEFEAAQQILIYNVRALVQATGMIQSSGAVNAINCKSRIYGPNGNSAKITQVTATGVVTVTVEASWMSTISKVIDNPLFTILGPATSTFTTTTTKVTYFDGTTSRDYTYADYPTLGLMLTAIANEATGTTVTKDVTTSDNTKTLNLFDIVSAIDTATVKTIKGDLKQLYDFLDLEVPDIEVTRESTATDMPSDFVLQFASGASGADPTATDWTNLLAEPEIADGEFGAMVGVCDGLASPYDSTLTKAVNALMQSHATNQAAAEKTGKKLQVFLPNYGGSGYSGVKVAQATVDATVTDSASYNSEFTMFVGFGLDDRDIDGVEHSFIPSYLAVKYASMAMGGPASRVLTLAQLNCVKATNNFKESDRKKLHVASVVFPVTDEKGTYINKSYTSWKSDNDPMLTVPSRVRCGFLSSNDLAKKFEAEKKRWAKDGVSPYISLIIDFAKRVLDSHKESSVNWLTEYGEVTATITGTQFNYEVKDKKVPEVPEIGFGKSTYISS